MTTIIKQVADAIITHPNETFMMDDLEKEFPEVKLTTLGNIIGRLKMYGYIESMIDRYTGGKIQKQEYRILKRESYEPKNMKSVPKKSRTPKPKTVKPKDDNNLSYSQVGKRIVIYIQELEKELNQSRSSFNDLQSTYHKEVAANRVDRKKNEDIIKDLQEQINNLREKIKRDSKENGVFNIGNIARFTQTKQL